MNKIVQFYTLKIPYLSRVERLGVQWLVWIIFHQEHVDENDEEAGCYIVITVVKHDPLVEDEYAQVHKYGCQKYHLWDKLAHDVKRLSEVPLIKKLMYRFPDEQVDKIYPNRVIEHGLLKPKASYT